MIVCTYVCMSVRSKFIIQVYAYFLACTTRDAIAMGVEDSEVNATMSPDK